MIPAVSVNPILKSAVCKMSMKVSLCRHEGVTCTPDVILRLLKQKSCRCVCDGLHVWRNVKGRGNLLTYLGHMEVDLKIIQPWFSFWTADLALPTDARREALIIYIPSHDRLIIEYGVICRLGPRGSRSIREPGDRNYLATNNSNGIQCGSLLLHSTTT